VRIRNALFGSLFSGVLAAAVAFGQAGAPPAAAPAQGLPERIAALKQGLAFSQQNIRKYQWIETTAVSYKGQVKSTTQTSCYYGADGNLQKVPIGASPPPEKKRGLRGAIAENKKDEMKDTIEKAVALVKTYIPPEPALLEASKAAGRSSMNILEPGKVVQLVFGGYRLPGDSLAITVDAPTNKLAGIGVATYLGDPSTPVNLNVSMGSLVDGTTYAAQIQLVLKSKDLGVTITNSGYRPLQ
jgi:hypothetical protein